MKQIDRNDRFGVWIKIMLKEKKRCLTNPITTESNCQI